MRHEPTPAERRLWRSLRRNQIAGFHFRRQHTIERFSVDFYCSAAKLVIEVDGAIHDYAPEEDAIRQEVLESKGLTVLRFRNEEIFDELEQVLEVIRETLQNAQT
jgi:very-short-patch-repair endonuclease